MVPLNRKPSCGTTQMRWRNERNVASRTSIAGVRDPSLDGVVEAGDQLRQRGLARAGRSDERDALAGRDVQRHVVQHPAAVGRVPERHLLDVDRALRRQLDRAGALGHVGRRVEQLVQLVETRRPPTAPC